MSEQQSQSFTIQDVSNVSGPKKTIGSFIAPNQSLQSPEKSEAVSPSFELIEEQASE